jgi:tripartite ATP-independent transporter DctM subunit
VPEMTKRGYPPEYATALTAASSVLGPLIPPSVVMIFYGALMNVSVAALFAGGILPGLLVASGLFAYNAYAARRYNLPGGRDTEMPPVGTTLVKALPALCVPMVMLGGIVFGLVTPTEAAALAVVIAIVTGAAYAFMQPGRTKRAAMRDFLGHINAALERSALLTGAIFVILFAAAIFGYLVAIQNLPQQIASIIDALGISGVGYLLLITVFFLIIGTFMDNMMAMVLLVPLLIPAASAGGADPVHVGVVVCLNLTIGLVSPPVGGVLMVVSAMSGVSYLRLARAILPLFLVLVATLVVLVLVPEITLYIPRQAGFVQ